jgi:hypothetical protein
VCVGVFLVCALVFWCVCVCVHIWCVGVLVCCCVWCVCVCVLWYVYASGNDQIDLGTTKSTLRTTKSTHMGSVLVQIYAYTGEPRRPRRLRKSPYRVRNSPGEPRRAEETPEEPRRAQASPEDSRKAQKTPGEPRSTPYGSIWLAHGRLSRSQMHKHIYIYMVFCGALWCCLDCVCSLVF